MSNFEEPLVSIVTPFHNVEAYLEECISSVLRQSYRNWEYVLLDNCSTDRSSEIAQYYQSRESRIRLVRNETLLDQVRNYNTALQLVSPDCCFVKVVQGDDWIFSECLSKMVKLADAEPSVALVSAYALQDDAIGGLGLPYWRSVFTGREICRTQLLTGNFFFGSPTTVLFRADVVRSRTPFFTEGRLHEDTEACYEILRDHDFGFVHQLLSYTRSDNDSISFRVRNFNPSGLDKLIIVTRYGRDFLSENEYRDVRERAELNYYRYLGRNLMRLRGKSFWDYHRRGLRTIDRNLDLIKIIPGAIRECLDLLLNPKRTIESVIATIRDRQKR